MEEENINFSQIGFKKWTEFGLYEFSNWILVNRFQFTWIGSEFYPQVKFDPYETLVGYFSNCAGQPAGMGKWHSPLLISQLTLSLRLHVQARTSSLLLYWVAPRMILSLYLMKFGSILCISYTVHAKTSILAFRNSMSSVLSRSFRFAPVRKK